jgi:hypothetical protein
LLQAVWHHQRLLRDRLVTADGRRVRVLHPGFWNHGAGPDFRDAVVQFASETPVSGDVEVDLRPGGWRAHAHDINADYRQVVLRVVWESGPGNAPALPVLALKGFLDAPLKELAVWLDAGGLDGAADALDGKCRTPLRELAADTRAEILRQAAEVRLRSKAMQFQARARQAGWEQALWEGIFGALGYKNNAWPMRRLAELISVLEVGSKRSAPGFQALLLGLSGLLPGELPRTHKASCDYLRSVWDAWWRERERLGEFILPKTAWRLSGLRPANHPQRRLALAAHWLAAGDLPEKMERWFLARIGDGNLVESLLALLSVEGDEFWSWHWTWNSARMKSPEPFIGSQRAADIAMNVVLPWCWMRAVMGGNEPLRETAEHRYFAWPKAEDNSVLRLARQRLFGGLTVREINSAAAQQGLLQIVRDFCRHSNAVCDECRFPALVKNCGSANSPAGGVPDSVKNPLGVGGKGC